MNNGCSSMLPQCKGSESMLKYLYTALNIGRSLNLAHEVMSKQDIILCVLPRLPGEKKTPSSIDGSRKKEKQEETIHSFQIMSSKRSINLYEHPEGNVEKVRCWNIEMDKLIVGNAVRRNIQNPGSTY
ncbi:unnamed protein product [Cuscuta campestris]|uniref:Uncharacterized protein n=1 Tax=Cuscuta campestris TaxID=132261 RepID=A0A484N8D4_9ASTE|nr:unnamed protein product [Cuscuta campestris]